MKQFLRASLVGVSFLLPVAVFAATDDIYGVFDVIEKIISQLTPIIAGIALVGFFWGLAKYIFNAGDEKKRKEGVNIMIWGILGLFVMVSVFGIVNVLSKTFEFGGKTITVPTTEQISGDGATQ